MDSGHNDAVVKLSDVERTSDNCLNELQVKIQYSREKLAEEKIISGRLQDIFCSLQGRMSVFCQASDDLEAEANNFHEMMKEAENEFANAKDESLILSCQMSNTFQKMMQDVQDKAARFENMRIKFKSTVSIEECSKFEDARFDEIMKEITHMDNEVLSMDKSGEQVLISMLSYLAIDDVMRLHLKELEQVEYDIADMSLKLYKRR